jgi:hypothetical protein
VLRRIFGLTREEVAVSRRKLHNEELHNIYSSPDILKVMKLKRRWAGHVSRVGEMRNALKNFGRRI